MEDAWKSHPDTQKARAFVERKSREALFELVNTALESSDPKVRAAAAEYKVAIYVCKALGSQIKDMLPR